MGRGAKTSRTRRRKGRTPWTGERSRRRARPRAAGVGIASTAVRTERYTDLLQLEFSSSSHVGIGIERAGDATTNGSDIHRGLRSEPVFASTVQQSSLRCVVGQKERGSEWKMAVQGEKQGGKLSRG